jgi:hypothetical protein
MYRATYCRCGFLKTASARPDVPAPFLGQIAAKKGLKSILSSAIIVAVKQVENAT